MWWAIGLYFFIGALAALGEYDRRDYDRRRNAILTFFFWPIAITNK